MTRLVDINSGNKVQVKGIEGGIGLAHKLRQLGLSPGDLVLVLRHAPFGGPLLVVVEGRELAIGRGIAAKIIVEEKKCGLV